MSNRGSSWPAAPAIPLGDRYGGKIAASGQLGIHALGDVYDVDGSGTVRELPPLTRGEIVTLHMLSAPTFAHSSRLIMPGSTSYDFSAGDAATLMSLGDGAWRCLSIRSASPQSILQAPQGRLTLTSATPITTADVIGATTVYYTPTVAGNLAPLYNGSRWRMVSVSELSLALDATSGHTGYHQTGKIFDLWLVSDAGTLRLGTGPAWSSDTSRGTGAATTEVDFTTQFPTNKVSMTLRFGSSSGNTITVPANQGTLLGSFRADGDGMATDSVEKRLLSNLHRPADRRLRRNDTAGWSYSSTTVRQANANTANQVAILNCVAGRTTEVDLLSGAVNSTTTPQLCIVGFGLDSITTLVSTGLRAVFYAISTEQFRQGAASIRDDVGIGYHYLSWLERGAGADTQTWNAPATFGIQGKTQA